MDLSSLRSRGAPTEDFGTTASLRSACPGSAYGWRRGGGGVDGGTAGDGALALWSWEAELHACSKIWNRTSHKIGGWVTLPWPEMDFS